MTPLHDLIRRINESSESILQKLEGEEPSFADIRSMMDDRQVFIDELNTLGDRHPSSSMNEDEIRELKDHFSQFDRLNTTITDKVSELMVVQREKLAVAGKQKKAEASYQAS